MGKQSSKLKKKEVTQLASETLFTEDEIQEWYKGFIEDCPKGKVTVDKLEEIYVKLFPKGSASAFANLAFSAYDKNNDGRIDFREFIAVLSVTKRGSRKDKLKFIFRMYDIDGNGYMTKKEMLIVLTAITRMVDDDDDESESLETSLDENVNVIFEKLDPDGNGRLSEEDFVQGLSDHPDLMALLQVQQIFGC